MKRLNTFFLLLLFVVSFVPANSMPRDICSALDTLDFYVKNHDIYVQRKFHHADSLKAKLKTTTDVASRASLYEQIGDVYRRCQIDSAMKYYELGRVYSWDKLDEGTMYTLCAKYSSILPLTGIVKEAIDIHDRIPVEKLPRNKKVEYYKAGNSLYLCALTFYQGRPYQETYYLKAVEMTDSLVHYMHKSDPEYKLYKAQQYFFHDDYTMALAELSDLVDTVDPSNNVYARAANMIGYYYMIKGDKDNQLYFNILSAISDISSGTREYTSLQDIGEELYKRGDSKRAFNYLNLAMRDAHQSGSLIRSIQTAETMPLINATAQQKHDISMISLIIVITFLALVVATMAFLLLRKQLKMRKMQSELDRKLSALQLFQQINCQLIDDVSKNLDSVEEFNRLLVRKLRAKQYADLLSMAESGKMLTDLRRDVMKNFDSNLGRIFPLFIEQLNTLLLPDKQLPVVDSGFTPELRIIFLQRMGIENVRVAARILGLSINTIYTYRNKIKSRAINRETFDQDLRNLPDIFD